MSMEEELLNEELTMGSFTTAVRILNKAFNHYENNLKKGIYSINYCQYALKRNDKILFAKLKERFDLDDAVITRMLDAVHHTNQIPLDILVIGEYVLIIYQNANNLEIEESSYLLLPDNYVEVSSNDFFGSSLIWNSSSEDAKNQALGMIIRIIDDCLLSIDYRMGISASNNIISYTYPNISAYCDVQLVDILHNIQSNQDFTFNVICKTDTEEVTCYEINVHDNDYEIVEIEYDVWRLSDHLKDKNDSVLKKS